MTKDAKMAMVIIEMEKDDHGGYIPCIVKEGEKGYFPTTWKYGDNIETAKKLADDYNTKLGISKEEAMMLVLQSMSPREGRKPSKQKSHEGCYQYPEERKVF